MHALISLAVVLLAGGCSEQGSGGAAPASGGVSDPVHAAAPTEPAGGAGQTPEPPAAPAAEPVDLLHSVPSALAVSSAFRDDLEQVSRLFDGDLTTAWNSRTGDLSRAWIAFRLPADARVTSIQMTAGFTKNADRDLFTGNHRVRRVRITHEGELVAEHALDVESRELQDIPATGAGGAWRIELADLVPGSHANWREACVSELRVMGEPGASARPGSVPSVHLSALPGAALAADGPPGDRPEEQIDEVWADDDDSDVQDPPVAGPGADPTAGPQIAQGEGLHLAELVLAEGVESRRPVNPRTTFSKSSDSRVYCYVRVENPERIETEIHIGWESVEHPSDDPGRATTVGASPVYVTFAYTGTGRRVGRYRCVVRDAELQVLGRVAYDLLD